MKRIILYFLIIPFLSNSSCQNSSKNDTIGEHLIQKLINDPAYLNYRKALDQDALNNVQNLYDLEGIGILLQDNSIRSICNVDDTIMSKYKGGILYKESECKRNELYAILVAKYPEYKNISEENRKALTRLYRKRNQEFNTILMDQIKIN